MRAKRIIPIMISVLLLPPIVFPAGDPDIVDVLYLCRSSSWAAERRDLTMSADPSISVLGVETVGAHALWQGTVDPAAINRRLRIYMPRSYSQLIEQRDLVVLHDVPHSHPLQPEIRLDDDWLQWWVRAVREEGTGLTMWGGDASWGGQGEQDNPSWAETVVEPILPFDGLPAYSPGAPRPMVPEFAQPDHPLAGLPWDTSPPMMVLNNVALKQGTTLVASARTGRDRFPWLAYWYQGEGKVTGETQVFSSLGGGDRMRREWDWWQDFVIYLAYLCVDKPIPDDIYRAHRIREEINTFVSKASLMVSLFEFIENFGISTVGLYQEMEGIHSLEKEAEEYFRRDDYDKAAEIFDEVNAAWGALNTRAIEVKENALVWVYLIEWLVVTGVSVMAGSVVWTLMVRRRLYREVGTTRTGS